MNDIYSEILKKSADEYINYAIDNVKINIPYVIVNKRWAFNFSCGKGSVLEISNELKSIAKRKGFIIKMQSPMMVESFMKKNKIGIDCSGFVYNVVRPLVSYICQSNLSSIIIKYPGLIGELEKNIFFYKRVRRLSADVLTNELNTVEIPNVLEAQPGDFIRLSSPDWRGKHIAIIIAISGKQIIYAHSSRITEKIGPHYEYIDIVSPMDSLFDQIWHEKTNRGLEYKTVAYKKEAGDGIRRLKCLNQATI